LACCGRAWDLNDTIVPPSVDATCQTEAEAWPAAQFWAYQSAGLKSARRRDPPASRSGSCPGAGTLWPPRRGPSRAAASRAARTLYRVTTGSRCGCECESGVASCRRRSRRVLLLLVVVVVTGHHPPAGPDHDRPCSAAVRSVAHGPWPMYGWLVKGNA
jgi:hypothetical protein